ncbi:unnamed protein product [Bursaphelenchus okinawaensis]|uniref:GPI alpha-1,4-mannosyltransferase I, catalytic subunit n=1 Tax=Bursaphelenchus okinawaensis TaxID=465554 RepID=A0A811K8C1_9BILA|nr:unnamed protein product [Bursaphelenchus okinawaensis]CAG9093933.1 unnamed protein product [Bursaphelenchus okinawaensis]
MESSAGDTWPIQKRFIPAFLGRLFLVVYAKLHDYLFHVRFTDIDYVVFTDAARHVYNGESPFARDTYRYSPFLAWILVPNLFFWDFGKILFCITDVLAGWLIYEIGKDTQPTVLIGALSACWLFNPFTAIISARGNADVVVCTAVLSVLLLLKKKQWLLAALVHGVVAIHLKIYPVIYLPSVFLYLANLNRSESWCTWIRKSICNWKGFTYVFSSILGFLALLGIGFMLYGETFLEEYLFYHVHRKDIKHNFSPYFLPLYLAKDDEFWSKVIGFGAFVPQVFCIVLFSVRYYNDLPMAWYLTTYTFVSFNKVCTSQYFIWYICFLPLVAARINLCSSQVLALIALWFIGQGIWLLPAYFLEFKGIPCFELIWLASLVFLAINVYIISKISMVLYLIGLGLGSEDDITVKGLRVIKACSKVYLESYTSILSYGYGVDKAKLEEFYGRELLEADREFVEQGCDDMINESKESDVALLVVGDPFGATTHADLVIRAKEQGVKVEVIHNTSILNAVGCSGLQLYAFGEVVSIVMWTDTWKPESFYDKIAQNRERGLHTLCLLDIKVKEQTVENMIKRNKKFEPPRFLTCSQAAGQLLEILKNRRDSGKELAFDEKTTVVGMARVGWPDQLIKALPLQEMAHFDMGSPLHSLTVPGNLHPLESRMLELF